MNGRKPLPKKRQRWDHRMGFILHLIGATDARIAELMKISEAAVKRRHEKYWAFGRA